MKEQRKYFNIITTEGSDEATILLYGYIGEAYDWMTGEQKGVTDIDFVQELERLAAKYNTINVRINSPGGEIFHGSAIVTAIRNCKAEVNTWIDGVAASMAGVIWMAGKKRHMAKNAMLMIHSASGLCWGNAADMREMADTLEAFDQSLVTSCADSLGMSEDDMKKKYFDGKDHWLTWNDVDAAGWLSSPDDYQAATKLPKDIAALSYRDLVAFFEKEKREPAPAHRPGFLEQVRDFIMEAFGGAPAQPSPINTLDMNLKEFQDSLAAGTLKLEEVKAHLATLEPPAPVETEEKTDTPRPVAADPLAAEVTALKQQLEDMKALVAAWGQTPGARKSEPGLPEKDLPSNDNADTPEALAKKDADKMAAIAASGNKLTFTPAAKKG